MKNLIIGLMLMGANANAGVEGEHHGSVGGRFQVVQISEFRKDQYLIDTQTGRLWQAQCSSHDSSGECSNMTWYPQEVVGLSISEKEFYKRLATPPEDLSGWTNEDLTKVANGPQKKKQDKK